MLLYIEHISTYEVFSDQLVYYYKNKYQKLIWVFNLFYLSCFVQNFNGELVLLPLLSYKCRVRVNNPGLVIDVELALLVAEDDVVVELGVQALVGIEG